MKVTERRAYQGPNQYALYPVVRLTVDLGPLEDYPSDRLQALGGFNDRLLAIVPTVRAHWSCFGDSGSFVHRLDKGTSLAHVLEHVAIALQNLTGEAPVCFGRTRATGERGRYHVVYSARGTETALAAGEVASHILCACLPAELADELGVRNPGYDPIADIHQFLERARTRTPGPSALALERAARARGIPVSPTDDHALVRLGHGRHQLWLRASAGAPTTSVGAELARDRRLSNRLMAEAGLPVAGSDPAEELTAIRDYRLLVIGGQLIAAARRAEDIAIDVTEQVHPDNRAAAERAAKLLGLEVAGIDFLHPDIAYSWRDVGGAIHGLDAAPGFDLHLAPAGGQPRDVARALIDHLYPPGKQAAIPIAAITGARGTTTTSRLLDHIYRHAGYRVGLANGDGVYIDGQLERAGDLPGSTSTRMVLSHPEVDAAVLALAQGDILSAGVATPHVDVGACLGVTMGQPGIDGVEEQAAILRVVPMIARDTAVLSADCPVTVAMADRCRRARHLMWVSADPADRVRRHIDGGGRAAVLERNGNEHIVLHDQGVRVPLIAVDEVLAPLDGAVRLDTACAMFAAAIAYAGGIPAAVIRAALRSFVCDLDTGRERVRQIAETMVENAAV